MVCGAVGWVLLLLRHGLVPSEDVFEDVGDFVNVGAWLVVHAGMR